jgi:HEAT repeat protein
MADTKQGTASDNLTKSDDIELLLAALGDKDYHHRREARRRLVEIGTPAVVPLVESLDNTNDDMRWEVTKTLGEIGDPATIPGLLKALEDDNFGVRWLATEGLIQLRRAALAPLFRLLIAHSDELWLREAAHHVLRVLGTRGFHEQVAPVLDAMTGEPAVEVPLASRAALDALEAQDRA